LGFSRSSPPGTAAAIDVTCTLPGVSASCAGVCPMMMTSESGDGSAASPIVPARRPGYRPASWFAGVLRSSTANAGEA